ncbi:Predicted ATPase [Rickettsia akari str. Hartford]|uniref:Predicted ATPase n=1 Tax=Rickettsia akari (strain Hartford) TaxID=293614 RepID=A8GPV4_RICAH|nr:Predicted ATPase [Rickettsia akari str. Hartford]
MQKTTLSKQFAEAYNISKINIFDIEDPLDLARLNEPMLA